MIAIGSPCRRGLLLAGMVSSALIHGGVGALAWALGRAPAAQPAEQVVQLQLAMFAPEPTVPTEVAAEPVAPASPAPLPAPVAQPAELPPPVANRPPPPPVEPRPKAKVQPRPEPIARTTPQPPPRRRPDARPRRPPPEPAAATALAPRPVTKPAADTSGPAGPRPPRPPAGQGSQASSSSHRASEEQAYLAALQAAIAARQQYPAEARRAGKNGVVAIAFVVLADGRITQMRVAKGSGVPSLDSAALDALRRLGRFRPLPATLGRDSLTVRVPILFDLRK